MRIMIYARGKNALYGDSYWLACSYIYQHIAEIHTVGAHLFGGPILEIPDTAFAIK